jgi:hypothetical protein
VIRALLLAIAFAGAMAFDCGGSGGGNFPDETPCPAAPPVATSRATPGTTSADAYVRRIQSFAVNLERLRADLRGTYPEDTFYRREEFRPDFAQYASQTVCTADAMLQMSAPDARFAEYESALDTALQDLVDHTREGREAVKARNVSDYRDWYAGADAKIAAVQTAAFSEAP